MSRLATLASRPGFYIAWALLVVAALGGTYPGDPYIFGFVTFFLAAASCPVGWVGLSTILFSKSVARPAKWIILGALALTAAAIYVALETLEAFQWA